MARRRYPDVSEMWFSGVLHEVNLRAFRRALVQCQVQGLYLGGHQELAAAAGTSRSTVSRVWLGRSCSLPTLLAIARVLSLDVSDVIRALDSRPPASE